MKLFIVKEIYDNIQFFVVKSLHIILPRIYKKKAYSISFEVIKEYIIPEYGVVFYSVNNSIAIEIRIGRTTLRIRYAKNDSIYKIFQNVKLRNGYYVIDKKYIKRLI